MSTATVRTRPGQRGYPLCAHCGEIRRNRPRGRFCSPACRQAAYRRRLAGVPEDLPTVPTEETVYNTLNQWAKRNDFQEVVTQRLQDSAP